jgi:hypothetical protein
MRREKKYERKKKEKKTINQKKKKIWVEKGGVLKQLILEGKEEIKKERKIKKKRRKIQRENHTTIDMPLSLLSQQLLPHLEPT